MNVWWGATCAFRHGFFQFGLCRFAVEPGEGAWKKRWRGCGEDAVALKVECSVSYHATQPWPFPSSLMLGCYAQALSRDFQIDGK